MSEEKTNDDYIVCLVAFCALMRGKEFPSPSYVKEKARSFVEIKNTEHIDYCLGLLDAERLGYLLAWCDEWKDHVNLTEKTAGLLLKARTWATMPTLDKCKKAS